MPAISGRPRRNPSYRPRHTSAPDQPAHHADSGKQGSHRQCLVSAAGQKELQQETGDKGPNKREQRPYMWGRQIVLLSSRRDCSII